MEKESAIIANVSEISVNDIPILEVPFNESSHLSHWCHRRRSRTLCQLLYPGAWLRGDTSPGKHSELPWSDWLSRGRDCRRVCAYAGRRCVHRATRVSPYRVWSRK